jgi:endonuclease/exonuclease/phosphatase family metal-dependent hydrolase
MQIYKHGSVGVDCIKELCEKLPEYKLCFFPAATYIDEPREYFGQATLVRKTHEVIETSSFIMHQDSEKTRQGYLDMTSKDLESITRICGIVKIEDKSGTELVIGNLHGPWGADGGADTPLKSKQYQKVRAYFDGQKCPWILAGDFNMPPDTHSMQELSKIGTNYSSKYGIKNTMNPLQSSVFSILPDGISVDHIFATPQVQIDTYELVVEPILSDHYGIFTTFTIASL